MISTLNPKISEAIAVVSVILLVYAYISNVFSIIAFAIGVVVSLPIIMAVWQAIEDNWKNVYKKFYSMSFHKRSEKVIYDSWRITWWIVPITLCAYGAISILLAAIFNDPIVNLGLMAGSLFTIATVTHHKSPDFYRQVRRR